VCTVIVVVPPSVVLVPFLMAARAFFWGGGTCVQLVLAQVGASPCGHWDVGKGCGLGSGAEQISVDGLEREEEAGASQKGLLSRWGII